MIAVAFIQTLFTALRMYKVQCTSKKRKFIPMQNLFKEISIPTCPESAFSETAL